MDINEDSVNDLYEKYMSFMQIMLEEHSLLEIASVLQVQALTIYRSTMSEEDYNKMVDNISQRRNQIQTFQQGKNLQ